MISRNDFLFFRAIRKLKEIGNPGTLEKLQLVYIQPLLFSIIHAVQILQNTLMDPQLLLLLLEIFSKVCMFVCKVDANCGMDT